MDTFNEDFRIAGLIAKYLRGDLEEKEREELEKWLADKPVNRQLFLRMIAEDKLLADYLAYGNNDKSAAWDRVAARAGLRKAKTLRLWPRIAAAALVLVFLGLGWYVYRHKGTAGPAAKITRNDVAPGRDRATLTLENGRKIILTKRSYGQLATQGNSRILVSAGSGLIYSAKGAAETEVAYNTLTTARGEQLPFPLVLPDGSRVWLNAASSIRFPVRFSGTERRVEITGEAYFEVAHDPATPFRVVFSGETVEVLGTHFDINAYNDEPVTTTTLLEGSIMIRNHGETARLAPGQQAQVDINKQGIHMVAEADLEGAVAWKNGYFKLDRVTLPVIMRQISRWYDVDVVYEGKIPPDEYVGKLRRSANLSEMIKLLELSNLHFRLENKKLTVLP